MEGKSGINFVLMIIAILFVVAGIAFCVLFGINQTIPGRTYNVAINLYIGLAGIALGALMLIGCNIATNARIAADNTYDTMRHVELLCKKEGISMADLARKDAKTAKKEAEMIVKEQEKAFEEQAQALAKAQADMMMKAQAQAQAMAEAQMAANAAPAAAPAAAEAPVAEAEAEEVAPQQEEAPVAPNCGIEYAEWKSKVEPLGIKCGACDGEMAVRNTKKGIVVLACKNAAGGNCKSVPLPIETMAQQFVEWYNEAMGAELSAFSMDAFVQSVGSVTVTDGKCTFVAK